MLVIVFRRMEADSSTIPLQSIVVADLMEPTEKSSSDANNTLFVQNFISKIMQDIDVVLNPSPLKSIGGHNGAFDSTAVRTTNTTDLLDSTDKDMLDAKYWEISMYKTALEGRKGELVDGDLEREGDLEVKISMEKMGKEVGRFNVKGWAVRGESGILLPFNLTRRNTGPHDVTFKIAYCGIYHSDLHQIRNDSKGSLYPMVPSHEIVGTVVKFGAKVKNFAAGDEVGVGCMVGSYQYCDTCIKGQEQYCEKVILTYGSTDVDGSVTFGGYSSLMVCNESFVVKVPENFPLDATVPLLCAGITVYSPVKYFQMIEPGKRLGVVGLVGFRHMAVKFGKDFGFHVTVISTSPNKEKEAREVLGVDHFIINKYEKQMEAAMNSLDYIIDTISANQAMEPLLSLLKVNGKLVVVGLPEKPV